MFFEFKPGSALVTRWMDLLARFVEVSSKHQEEFDQNIKYRPDGSILLEINLGSKTAEEIYNLEDLIYALGGKKVELNIIRLQFAFAAGRFDAAEFASLMDDLDSVASRVDENRRPKYVLTYNKLGSVGVVLILSELIYKEVFLRCWYTEKLEEMNAVFQKLPV